MSKPWNLIPCLHTLFDEFDAIAPNRDKASDGAVADEAHYAGGTSDHIPDEESAYLRNKDADTTNEVHAIDVDSDLREADFTMEMVVQYLLGECRKSNSVGLDRGRLRYIIYNRRIWEAKDGWVEKEYHGASPHEEHAHFSAEYDTPSESDVSTWGLVERFGFMDKNTFFAWLDEYYSKYKQDENGWKSNPVGSAVLNNQFVPNPLNNDGGKAPMYDVIRDTAQSVKNIETIINQAKSVK